MTPEPTADDTQQSPRNTQHATRNTQHAALLVAAVAIAIRLYLMLATHRTVEDFYITLRYAVNLAQGHGFVYNDGQRVLGTTTPLYTLYLALVAWLGLDATLWGKLLNIAADGASCWLLARLGRAAGRPCAGLTASVVLEWWPVSVLWSISGMETALVTLAGLAALVCLAERRPTAMGAWLAALVLLRIDGLLLATVAFGALAVRAWRERSAGDARALRAVARALALFVLLLLPWTVFAWRYFGSPVPTSFVAKLHVYAWQARGGFPNLAPFARQMSGNALHLLLLAGALAGLGVVAARARRLAPAVVWMLLYYAGMAFSKAFLFGWYYAPPAPVYILVAMLGWGWALGALWQAARGAKAERPGVGATLAGAALLLLLIAGLATVPRQERELAAAQREDEDLLKPIGLALRTMVRPGETVMLEPIGYIGYYSGARILDAVGLVSPEVIPFYRPGAVSPYLDMMAALKPEWALLRAGENREALAARVPPDRALLANYRLVRTFSPTDAPPNAPPAFYLYRRRAANGSTTSTEPPPMTPR